MERNNNNEEIHMKKLYITILLAAILITGAMALINSNTEEPTFVVSSASWTKAVFNNSHLADRSDSIIIGRVIEILPSRWNTPDGIKPTSDGKMTTSKEEFYKQRKAKKIYTDVIIKVDRIIKNKSTPAMITVRTIGGEVGEYGMIVEDEAKFEAGENVLLFLTKEDTDTDNSAGTHYRVYDMKYGKFSITNDNQAVRPDLPEAYKKIPLEELLNSIGAQ